MAGSGGCDRGRRRVVALGVEVASARLIDRWCREGHLPHLDALRRRGCWGILESVCDVSSGSIWPSLYTGTNPAKHGIAFFHMQLVNETYHVEKFGPDRVRRPPMWKMLEAAGRRCTIVDVPVTRPDSGFDGVLVSAWGVEGPAWERASWPPDLMGRILAEIGPYPLPNDDARRYIRPETRERRVELSRLLLSGLALKTRLLKQLARENPWDFFLAVFSETHWADHVLYHAFDASHPEHPADCAGGMEGFLLDLCKAQDRAIGEVLAEAPDATVIVFSGSGMRANYSGNHLLPDVLERLGYAGNGSSVPNAGSSEARPTAKRWAYYRIRKIQDALPEPVLTAAKRLVSVRLWEKWTRRVLFSGLGWASSRAFCLPNDFCGSIRINLKHREPKGTVEPREYDAICARLTKELLELENVATGQRAVVRVIKTRDAYRGENGDFLPDLSVVWADEAPITGLRSPRIGVVMGTDPERRTGAHHPEGFVILAGPGVRTGNDLEGTRLVDLAPTILHLLDAAPSPDMDGRVLHEALAASLPPEDADRGTQRPFHGLT